VRQPVALALRALGLGDFLTGLPALSLLRQALPEHRIVLAAPAALAPLVHLVPTIDSLYARGELERLDTFPETVDVGIDLHGKGPASRRLLMAIAQGPIVGFADPAAGLAGPTWRRQEHEVVRWCRLVRESFALPAPDGGVVDSVAGSLRTPDVDAPEGLTIVHPGAAAAARRWPADRFVTVARALIAQGRQVVITGGPAEHALVHEISGAAKAEPLLDLSLLQLAGAVAKATLVVCGDTGVAHLASAYRTPSVLLFGPVSPAEWGPPTDRRHVVIWHGDGAGDPHGPTPDPALLSICPQEVLAAVHAHG
jgi:ADP-heptose:LPS heptosyltransferase